MSATSQECDLTKKNCQPCEGGVPPMTEEEIEVTLKQLNGWEYKRGRIGKIYRFKNHYETIAFVNAVAWISNREGHHPDMEVGYNTCAIYYITHSIGGMSENDFICAAKIDGLIG